MTTKTDNKDICDYCGEAILFADLEVIHDGERMHLQCAAQASDEETFDRDMGFDGGGR